MMSIEQIREYMHRVNVTHDEVSKNYEGEKKKGVAREYIVQLLTPNKNMLNEVNYRKLINAINETQADKDKSTR
jgi:hypothetical protein